MSCCFVANNWSRLIHSIWLKQPNHCQIKKIHNNLKYTIFLHIDNAQIVYVQLSCVDNLCNISHSKLQEKTFSIKTRYRVIHSTLQLIRELFLPITLMKQALLS